MAIFFYNLFLIFYRAGISIASAWNKKAGLWLLGRKNIFETIKASIGIQQAEIIWFHCSSLGEFEQGRPVLEKLKSKYPNSKFLLTFFSPSGYEIKKNYSGADWVFYLPMDSKTNASKFLDAINPALVVFVKYDYWHYYLTACKKRKIPLLMISAKFRESQPFFQWYGSFHRKMLKCFTHFFVQDVDSSFLLQKIELNNVTVAGDTRFDRVLEIAEKSIVLDEIEKFCSIANIFIAGSTWPADEKIIKEATSSFPELKLIIAPHEIDHQHLSDLKVLFPNSLFYSDLISKSSMFSSQNCLIIDNIGMLSKLYSYATITYIGGGFDQGIHNLLEAAVYGRPVIFGPRFNKFKEATDLIKADAGFSINNKNELEKTISYFLADNIVYRKSSIASKNYVYKNRGATEKIIHYIQENRLLTN